MPLLWSRILVPVLFALWVIACKGEAPSLAPITKPAEAVQKAPPIEVVLWHSYREGEKVALETLVQKFNQDHENIQVRLLNVPYDAFVDKVTIATPRGQGPDLFIFAHNMIGEWVDTNRLLEPLSDKIPGEVLKRFLPQTVKALVYKQSLYGLPLAFKSLALFFNPDLVKVAPSTADELIKTAAALTDPGKDQYGLVYEASLLYNNAPFLHGYGGRVLDDNGAPTVATRAMADGLAFIRSLVRKTGVPRANSAMLTSLFNDNKAAMAINGPWFLGELKPGLRFEVAPLPTLANNQPALPFLGSEAIFLSAFSKQKEAAIEVMVALTSDDAAFVRLQTGRQTVANLAVYDRPEVKADRVVTLFREQAEKSVLMPSRPEMQAVWATMDMAINKVVFGDADPATALDEAQKKITSDLGKMKR